MRLASLVVASLTVTGIGCATFGGSSDDEEDVDIPESYLTTGRNEALPSVTYGQTAQENFERGEAEYADGEHLAAQRYFAYVKTKFPYTSFAPLAELRIGDCQLARERYVEAIDTYQNFIRLHPTHPKVPYARYRVGLGYYEQIPSDWFLLPPSEEKDQAAVRDAEKAIREYVETYPNDEGVAEAKVVLAEVRGRLMAHERYAADFYDGIDKDRAYVGRLEIIRTKFADVGLDDELLVEIIEVYARLGDVEQAKARLAELKEKFPTSDLIRDAEETVASTVPAPPS